MSFEFTDEPLADFNLLLDPPDQDATLPAGIDPLTEQVKPGWVMSFPQTTTLQSRVTTEAFVVGGVIIFSTFDPTTVATTSETDLLCERTGTTRAFVVMASNGAPVQDLSPTPPPAGGGTAPLTAEDRFHEIDEFTTAPFIERTASKNDPELENEKTILDVIEDQIADSVRMALIENLPRGSRFNDAFQVVVAALRNSTGVQIYASIPIATYPADWRDP